MSRQQLLASAVDQSARNFARFTAGFTEQTRARSAPGLPNHLIWTLGHLSLYLYRAAECVEPSSTLPASDFFTGDGSGVDESRFDTESICFNSTPSPIPDQYSTLERGIEIFHKANAHLVQVVRNAKPDSLDRRVQWGASAHPTPVAEIVLRICFHTMTHAGQVIDLRRALNMPRVI